MRLSTHGGNGAGGGKGKYPLNTSQKKNFTHSVHQHLVPPQRHAQNHHGSSSQRLSIASSSSFFARLSRRLKWIAEPISVCSVSSVKPYRYRRYVCSLSECFPKPSYSSRIVSRSR